MAITLLARIAGWRWMTPTRPEGTARVGSTSPELAPTLAVADALDRRTAWPMHRIRCALHERRHTPSGHPR